MSNFPIREIPQLRLRHPLGNLPSVRFLPQGCQIRVASSEDAEAISMVLTGSFEEPWTSESVLRRLLDDPGVPLTFVAEQDGKIVGTASYQVKTEPDPEAGWLHWVAIHPEARGLALGEIISHRVLQEAFNRKRSCVMLTTDDVRLAAIRTYLRLGFEPDMWHETHESRWAKVMQNLS